MKYTKKRLLHLSKVASGTLVIQSLIQALGMLVGFVIVRLLPQEEYAYYTIANTMLGMMNTLSNCGISTGMYALGAKVWEDKQALGKVLSTSIRFRNKFAIVALVICIPITCYLLYQQNASYPVIAGIIVALVPNFKSQLTDNLYQIVPKLHQELGKLQKNQMIVAVLRLIFNGLSLFLFPFTWIALLANGIPRIIGNIRLREIAKEKAEITTDEDIETKKELKKILTRTLPSSLYFAFSGQISLFILSFVGKTTSIAEWGALGRYAVIFTVLSTFFAMVALPRYARKKPFRKELIATAHQIILLIFLSGGLIIGGMYIFSDFLLYLLGPEYAGLDKELLIVSINGFLAIANGTFLALSIRRGWIIHPVIDILVNFLPLVAFVWIFPLNSLLNVLYFNMALNLSYLVARYIIFWYKLLKNTEA